MAQYVSRPTPGVREDPRLVRESMESSRASVAYGQGAQPGYGGGGGYSEAGGAGGVQLEPFSYEGRSYLLDRRTGGVYAETSGEQYPQLVGKMGPDGRVVMRGGNVVVDLFSNLDRYLRENKVKFKDLFDSYDTDRSGSLEIRELAQLVKQLVPGVKAADVKYIMAMMDTGGDGSVSQQEFLSAAKSSLEAARKMQADRASGAPSATSDVQLALRAATDFLRANRVSARSAFDQFDADRNGRLEPRELARFFATAIPGVREDQLRYLLAHMYEMDANGDGSVSYEELLYALRAADSTRAGPSAPQQRPPSPSAYGAGGAGGAEMALEPYSYEGRSYLLDRRTGGVYAVTSGEQYPQLVGKMGPDGRVVMRGGNVVVDLFSNLDRYLRENKVKFKDLFDSYDTDRSGSLEIRELAQLVKQLVPGVKAADVKYIMAMMDTGGDGSVTQQEFLSAAKSSLEAARKMQADRASGAPSATSDVQLALRAATDFLRANRVSARSAFDQFDADRNGRLEPRELARFFATAIPGVREDQLRYLLAHMYEMDANGDGSVSYEELLYALRAADSTRAGPSAPQQRPPSPSAYGAGGAGGAEMALEPYSYEGRSYLLDRRTGGVYAVTSGEQYPQLVGKMGPDGRVVMRGGNVVVDLFSNLDRYLRENKVKFKDLFDSYDTDRSGSLEIRELAQLVKQLVPGVKAADVKYIMAMMDTGGDGSVSQQEFLSAAKSSLEAARKMQADRASGAPSATSDVQLALRAATDFLRANRVSARSAFDQFDADRNGRLEPRELARFFATAIPGVREDQLRYLLAHMYEMDANGDGSVSYEELLYALRAADSTRAGPSAPQQRPPSPSAYGAGGAGGAEMALEPYSYEGRSYLLDRRTGGVYAVTSGEQYPQLVGKMGPDGRVVMRGGNVVVDLFSNLDRYLRENKVKFKDLFDSYDTDRSGSLEIRELAQLVKQLVPGVKAADVKYIMAMMDTGGDGSVSQQEFLSAAKSSLEAARKMQADRASGAPSATSDVQLALRAATDFLRANRVSARSAFDQFDADRNGRLEPRELARFFATAIPGVREDQLRYLLAHMYEMDANGDGSVSYEELLYALRAADASRAGTGRTSPSPGAKPGLSRAMTLAAQPGGTEWVLEDVVDPNTGRRLKRDPATGLVYEQTAADGEWPQVVGVQDASGVLRMMQRREDAGLFAALDSYLRTNKVKARDTFDHFDADRSGYLDMAELRQMVAALLPGFTEGQLHYFQALLDINGDGGISFEEMMAVAKECLAAERAAQAPGAGRDPAVRAALDRFQAYLMQYPVVALQHFESADATRRGALKFPEFARFLHQLMPDLKESSRRHILSYLWAQDVDQSGLISWLMLARFMRVPQLSRVSTAGMAASPPPAATAGFRRTATTAHRVKFEGENWQLQEVVWRGQTFLLDPHTQRVYQEDPGGGWPRLVGTYRNGEVVMQDRNMAQALFETLDAYLKQQRMKAREVFAHFDAAGKGWLAPEELGRLVEHFLPGKVTPGDIKYFQVMVDRNQDGKITYEEFIEAARHSRAEEQAARERTDEARRALQNVSDFARQYPSEMKAAFARYDVNRNGLLEPRELAQMLRATVQPPLDAQALRYVMAHLHTYDMDGDGALSYREFAIAMRAIDAIKSSAAGGAVPVTGNFMRTKSAHGGVGHRPSTSNYDSEEDVIWTLQELPYNGHMLLVDPRTQRVYVSPDGRSWPQLLGKLTNGRLTRAAELRPNDLWTRVDTYLRTNKVKLQELYNLYDADRSGSLRPSELGRLIRDMVPDATRAELHYFLAIMDANGDGTVTYDEFLAAAKDSLRATQQMAVGGGGSGTATFPPDVLAALDELSSRLAEQPALGKRIFAQCDKNGDGALDLSEAGKFLRSLMPELGGRPLQFVLSYLGTQDLDGEGVLRYSELMTGLHALQARGPRGVTYSRSFTAPAANAAISALVASGAASNRGIAQAATAELLRGTEGNRRAYTKDWELHEWRVRGATYLLDPVTDLVYSDVGANQWPELVGRKVGESYQPLDGSATMVFFRNLDQHLKSMQVKFSTLFNEFDHGLKGYLERSELASLVRRVMPEATDSQIRFLAVVLDENGDKMISQQELLGAAKKVVDLLRQQKAAGGQGTPPPEVAAVLDRFSRFMRENMDKARTTFEALDVRRQGYLDYDGVAAFFRRLAPRLGMDDMRHLLAQVHLYDVEGVGQVTFSELLRALRAADLHSARGSHATGWAAAVSSSRSGAGGGLYDSPSVWRLEAYRWNNKDVLLDPATRVIYSKPQTEAEWPTPLGRLTSTQAGRPTVIEVQPDSTNFFKRLNTYLRDNGLQLRQLFDRSDRDRSGLLDTQELGMLVKQIMPSATAVNIKYFMAMMDVDGSQRVSFEEFTDACKSCVGVEAAAGAAAGDPMAEDLGASEGLSPAVAAALRKLSENLVRNRPQAVQVFKQADRDGSGRLEPGEVSALLRSMSPSLTVEDLRTTVAVLFRHLDHDGDGTLSFQEFMFAMRAVEMQAPHMRIAPGSWQPGRAGRPGTPALPSAANEPVLTSLDLYPVPTNSRYLFSRYNYVVYEALPPQGSPGVPAWPVAVGTLDRSTGSVTAKAGRASSADLFGALDTYLRTNRVRFGDLFARYDQDRSGKLEPRELGRLVADLLGPAAANPADVAYFVAMLDLDGSRGVSEQEFMAVAKDYLALEKRTADIVGPGAQADETRRSLERVSRSLQTDRDTGVALFARHDTDQDGRLTLMQLAGFLTDLLRGQRLATREMHTLITHAHSCDVPKTGRFTFNDLLVAFRAIPVRYPGGQLRAGFASSVGPSGAPGGGGPMLASAAFAQLEAFVHGGATYYRDPLTGLVYQLVDDRRSGPRMELAPFRTAPGRGGAVLGGAGRGQPNAAERLFNALDAALKEQKVRLRDVFDRYDANRNGRLDARELVRLVRDLLPDATDADLRYLLAMLDYDGDSAVSYEELTAAIKECWAAGRVHAGGSDDQAARLLEGLLERVGQFLRSQGDNSRAAFARFDTNGNGRLEPRELARFLRACMPELSSADIRHLITHLHSIDANGDGALSYPELMQALYAVELRLPDGRRVGGRFVSKTGALAPGYGPGGYSQAGYGHAGRGGAMGAGAVRQFVELREWRLEPWHCAAEGRELWLDRDSGLVYQPMGAGAGAGGRGGAVPEEGPWPMLLGARTRDGGLARIESTLSARFFAALDRKLRTERMRLEDLLGGYDRDGNAGLDERELGQLARGLLGEELSSLGVKFLMATLDLDGDRMVSRQEVVEVFKQLGEAGTRIAGLQEPRVVELLNRLSFSLGRNLRAAWERFCRADVNGSGALEPRELKWFLDGLLTPGSEDVRTALTYLHLLDVNANGRLEWRELLVALRVIPVRTPIGVLRPPSPPFRVRRPGDMDVDRDRDRRGYGDSGPGKYDEYDRGQRGYNDGRNERGRYDRDRASEDETDDAGYRRVDASAAIPDREFVFELRPVGGRGSSRRRSSDAQHGGGGGGGELRDPDTGLVYAPPDGGYGKGSWPQLVGFEDGRRPVPPLPSWRLLVDLEEAARADPDRLAEGASRRRSAAGSARGGGSSGDTMDTRTAASALLRAAADLGGSRPEPWEEGLLRGMLEVMHERGVRARKLPRDAQALGAAFALLTDGREGVALLRDVAASLSREYRQVVRAMRKKAIAGSSGNGGGDRGGGYERGRYSRDGGGAGGEGEEAVLRVTDIRDVLQDTLPEVMSAADSAMAVLLYLLYQCPHCLAKASGSAVTLGWKDVFKALRAVKCRHPDGTSRVGVWDAEELVRRASRRSSRSSSPSSEDDRRKSSSGRRRSTGGRDRERDRDRSDRDRDRSDRDRDRDRDRHYDRDRDRDRRRSGSGRDHYHHRSRSRDSYDYDRYDDRGYDRYGSPGRRSASPYGRVSSSGYGYGGGYMPPGAMAHMGRMGPGSAFGQQMPYDLSDQEAMAAMAAAGGMMDPAAAAALQRAAAAGINRTLTYRTAAAAISPGEDPALVAVKRRMAGDLRMSKTLAASPSARRLNLSLRELARRKVHPERRVVPLEPYAGPDGKQYTQDPATGLVYFPSQNPEEYPELAGKLRASGELALGGGTSAPLQSVFNSLRTLDESVLVQLFKAYDTNGNGTLELKELMALLRDVAGLPYAEAGLVQALLDVDLSNTLTLREWVEGIRASTDVLDAATAAFGAASLGGTGGGGASKAQRAALTVLAAVSVQVAADLDVFWAAYARADKDGNGYLDVAELARFFKDLFRDMPPYDLRLLVAHCFTADMEKDGMVRPDELLQHLRAIPLKAPNGITHRTGFRLPTAAGGRSGLMDSIPMANRNARLQYNRVLSVDVPDTMSAFNESLSAKLPAGAAFPAHPASPHGAASVLSYGGMPTTPALAAAGLAPGGLPYVPVPVPMPMPMPMMGAGGAPGGPGSVMGYLLPYHQDMYQALYDRLAPRSSAPSVASRHTRRASEGAGSMPPGSGSDPNTPLSSDDERALAPREAYPELAPHSHRSSGRRRSSQSGAPQPYARRSSRSGAYGYPQQPGMQYDTYGNEMPYDPQQQQPYQGAAPSTGGCGYGTLIELQRVLGGSPAALRSNFMAFARKVASTAQRPSYTGVGAAGRPAYNTGGFTYVVPRQALGQLLSRAYPGLRDSELRYAVDLLGACLPYNTASYTEEDLAAGLRQGAAVERAVGERRLPGDVAALAARLADDILGNEAFTRSAFRDFDRYRRGSLPLPEALRLLGRLATLPPHAHAWLMAGLAEVAMREMQGAGDMTYTELGNALMQLSRAAPAPQHMGGASGGMGAPPPYGDPYGPPPTMDPSGYPYPPGAPYGPQQPYGPQGQQPYGQQQQPYGPPQPYGAQGPMSPGGSMAAGYQDPRYPNASPPGSPGPYDPRYGGPPQRQSYSGGPARQSYSGGPSGYGPQQPYGGPQQPYSSPTHPGPYANAAPPYGHTQAGPYGADPYGQRSPYGSPPGSPGAGAYGGGAYGPGAPAYSPRTSDPGYMPPGGPSMGQAYYMWTQENRHAVVQKHLSSLLKGRATEMEAQGTALAREAAAATKVLDLSNALLQTETAQRDVLALIQGYTSAGAPPVSVQDMVARIGTALGEALQLARSTAQGGGMLAPPGPPPADFESLLDALTNARWVSGQPVSVDTLRAALALRRDAFALRRAHAGSMMELERQKQGLQLASQEASQAMAIQMQLLQSQLQRQAQELQQRLVWEAQALAASAAANAGGAGPAPGASGSLPGLLLPPAHAGSAVLVGADAASRAAANAAALGGAGMVGAAGSLLPLGSAAAAPYAAAMGLGSGSPLSSPPRMVLSPRTWQMEPAGAGMGAGTLVGMAGSPGRMVSAGGAAQAYSPGMLPPGSPGAAAVYPAPARD
ncbi:hypothetical protein HYH03_008653 [Edaphochlamys debaryana]|uniref:EF-hand domain-containing protein n=1 Tax=Edaphochlamys debaryana TaxID=47281 RepID=A0A835Y0Z0_9CHLO|nr:hypothetical protein HYH03_008653 [Edaphochlamys debaryana]|eukprot:KAG2493237.1 hypothetical protein HYH03_008653 [Edaphochlamys debaryana]